MGHYAREIDPGGCEDRDKQINRQLGLRREIETIPLSFFKAADLIPLIKLFTHTFEQQEFNQHDFEYLRNRLREIKGRTTQNG